MISGSRRECWFYFILGVFLFWGAVALEWEQAVTAYVVAALGAVLVILTVGGLKGGKKKKGGTP